MGRTSFERSFAEMDRSGEPERYKSVQGLEEGCEGCERSTLCERCQPRNRGHTPLLIAYCTRQYPVPLHIRNAPTKLMKNLDYGKEYRYEPRFAHPVHQEFLPPELRTTRFVSPPLNVAGSSTIDTEEHQVRIDGPVLRPSDGQGPGACQRIFEIGSESGSCLRICHKYPAGSKKEGGGGRGSMVLTSSLLSGAAEQRRMWSDNERVLTWNVASQADPWIWIC